MTAELYVDLATRLGVNLVGAVLLVAIYLRNYKRLELAAVFMAANIGLFSGLSVLATSVLSAAVGFGLFGILSIIRLRSETYEHIEIAYFFMALATALITAIDTHPIALSLALVLLLALTMFVFDNNRLRRGIEFSHVVLGRVYENPGAVRAAIAEKLGAEVLWCRTTDVNFVNETTTVSVVYRSIG